MGGDILPGTSLLEGLQVLADDEATEAIAICGEIGGHAEVEAAEWIKEYRSRTESPKYAVPQSPKASTGKTLTVFCFRVPGP